MIATAPAETQSSPAPAATSVSVIVPAYNAAGTIGRALASVAAQTYADIAETIVVDDGSSDGTAEVVATCFPHAVLIRQANAGNAAARNRGVQHATGGYLAFLDADDEWLPVKLEQQVRALDHCPGTALVLCGEVTRTAEGAEQRPREAETCHSFSFAECLSGALMRHHLSISCSSWLFRRSCFERLEGFDVRLPQCVDFEMVARTAHAGFGVSGIGRNLFIRHMQPASVTQGPRAQSRRYSLLYDVIRRYDPALQPPGLSLLSAAEFAAVREQYLLYLLYALAGEGDREGAARVLDSDGFTGASRATRLLAALSRVSPRLLVWLGDLRKLHRRRRG